jgi:hypothetical protein
VSRIAWRNDDFDVSYLYKAIPTIICADLVAPCQTGGKSILLIANRPHFKFLRNKVCWRRTPPAVQPPRSGAVSRIAWRNDDFDVSYLRKVVPAIPCADLVASFQNGTIYAEQKGTQRLPEALVTQIRRRSKEHDPAIVQRQRKPLPQTLVIRLTTIPTAVPTSAESRISSLLMTL